MQVDAEVEDGYGPEEAAEMLGKGIATVWRWLRDDKIAAVRIGGRVLIPKKEPLEPKVKKKFIPIPEESFS